MPAEWFEVVMMRHRLSALSGVIVLMAMSRPGYANPADSPEFSTRFVNTSQPMDAMLKGGYRIASMTMSIDSMGFVLEHGGKWVMCTVRAPDKPGRDQMLSQCFSMN